MSVTSFEYTVPDSHDGVTLKSFLRRNCGLTDRSLKLLKYHDGGITRGGSLVKANERLQAGDVIVLHLPQELSEITPTESEPSILYEDDYLLIVNKPSGMPVHPTKVHQTDTLANIVAYYQKCTGESYLFRALNRLDKDTSGVVILAKDRLTYALVKDSINKTYIAVCEGIITEPGVIDQPIALEPMSKIKRCVCEGGQPAVTYYKPLRPSNGHTMLRLRLKTGRTHQIRCHMSSIGHPLAGDDLYGGSRELICRQALHCDSAELLHPVTREKITVNAKVPEEFYAILKEG